MRSQPLIYILMLFPFFLIKLAAGLFLIDYLDSANLYDYAHRWGSDQLRWYNWAQCYDRNGLLDFLTKCNKHPHTLGLSLFLVYFDNGYLWYIFKSTIYFLSVASFTPLIIQHLFEIKKNFSPTIFLSTLVLLLHPRITAYHAELLRDDFLVLVILLHFWIIAQVRENLNFNPKTILLITMGVIAGLLFRFHTTLVFLVVLSLIFVSHSNWRKLKLRHFLLFLSTLALALVSINIFSGAFSFYLSKFLSNGYSQILHNMWSVSLSPLPTNMVRNNDVQIFGDLGIVWQWYLFSWIPRWFFFGFTLLYLRPLFNRMPSYFIYAVIYLMAYILSTGLNAAGPRQSIVVVLPLFATVILPAFLFSSTRTLRNFKKRHDANLESYQGNKA